MIQGELNYAMNKKVQRFETLDLPITWALRKAKQHLEPEVGDVSISIECGGRTFLFFGDGWKGDPGSLTLKYHKPIEEMLALPEDNQTIGELAIAMTETLLEKVREAPGLVKNFPFKIFEDEIAKFRDAGYGFTVTGRSFPIDETDLRAKFEICVTCEKITSTMILLKGRRELDRRMVREFPGGQYIVAQNYTHILLEEARMEVTNFFPNMSTFINFDEFPASVRALLPVA